MSITRIIRVQTVPTCYPQKAIKQFQNHTIFTISEYKNQSSYIRIKSQSFLDNQTLRKVFLKYFLNNNKNSLNFTDVQKIYSEMIVFNKIYNQN